MLVLMQSFGRDWSVCTTAKAEDQEFTSLSQGKNSLCLASVGVYEIGSACELSCSTNLSIFNNGGAECLYYFFEVIILFLRPGNLI